MYKINFVGYARDLEVLEENQMRAWIYAFMSRDGLVEHLQVDLTDSTHLTVFSLSQWS